MDTTYNTEFHNQTYIYLKVVPSKPEEIKRNLTFNWTVIEFQDNYMDIQLYFDYPN